MFGSSPSRQFYKVCASLTVIVFLATNILCPVQVSAQQNISITPPTTLVSLSQNYAPAIIKGLTIHPDQPLMFDFIVHPGDDSLKGDDLKAESTKLIKYFMASLTIPEKEMWVNLSPYEADRIIPEGFGKTQMGQDMLVLDYQLKQLTASLMHPDEKTGKAFWDRVYSKVQKQFGTTDIPLNTFNKIWVVPEKATVFENGSSVVITDAYLKVMLEKDYLALAHHSGEHPKSEADEDQWSELTTDIVRTVLIPEIEKEVNEGKTFANLRQIYNSVILATWFKQNLKESILGHLYVDHQTTKGIEGQDQTMHQRVYDSYLELFQKGAYDFIKEEYDPASQQVVPRKYFSGGITEERVGRILDKAMTPTAIDEEALEESVSVTTQFGGSELEETLKETLNLPDLSGILSSVPGSSSDIEEEFAFIEDIAPDPSDELQSRYEQMGVTDIGAARVSTSTLQGNLFELRRGETLVGFDVELDAGEVLHVTPDGVSVEQQGRTISLLPSRQRLEGAIAWAELAGGYQVNMTEEQMEQFPLSEDRPQVHEEYLQLLFNIEPLVEAINKETRGDVSEWTQTWVSYYGYIDMKAAASLSDDHIDFYDVPEGLQTEIRQKIMNAFLAVTETEVSGDYKLLREAMTTDQQGRPIIPQVTVLIDPDLRHRAAEVIYFPTGNQLRISLRSETRAEELTEGFLISALIHSLIYKNVNQPWNIWSADPHLWDVEVNHPTDGSFIVSEDQVRGLRNAILNQRAQKRPRVRFRQVIPSNSEVVKRVFSVFEEQGGFTSFDKERYRHALRSLIMKLLVAESGHLELLKENLRVLRRVRVAVQDEGEPRFSYHASQRRLTLHIQRNMAAEAETLMPVFIEQFIEETEEGDEDSLITTLSGFNKRTNVLELPTDAYQEAIAALENASFTQNINDTWKAHFRELLNEGNLELAGDQLGRILNYFDDLSPYDKANYRNLLEQFVEALNRRLTQFRVEFRQALSDRDFTRARQIMDEAKPYERYMDENYRTNNPFNSIAAEQEYLDAVAASIRVEQPRTYYDVLGISRDAEGPAIKAAFRKLAFENHPDKAAALGIPVSELERRFKDINNAFETLYDPDKKRRYDLGLDSAMTAGAQNIAQNAPGGIDFNPNNMELDRQGEGVNINLPAIDPAMLQGVEIYELSPTILRITPVMNLPMLLGVFRTQDSKPIS